MEIWKDITDFDNYEVSTFGNVRNKNTKRLIAQHANYDGYLLCSLYINGKKKGKGVHRLVALAFIENPENKSQVDHKDDNPLNNNVTNLQWATKHENMVKRQYIKNAKNIYKQPDRKSFRIIFTSNGITHRASRKTQEDAEAVLAEWKRLYPHKII